MVENLAEQLTERGKNVSGMAIMTGILGTLPPKNRTLCPTFMSLDPLKQNLIKTFVGRRNNDLRIRARNSPFVNDSKTKGQLNQNEFNGNGASRRHFAKECRAPEESVK